MDQYATSLVVHDIRELQLSFAPNPSHPLNADYLHSQLLPQRLGDRDRDWTLWLNSCIWYGGSESVVEELLGWAEKADPRLIPEEQVFLLATTLGWFLTTTVVTARNRVTRALGRLLSPHIAVAARWVRRFMAVDDPYITERVLMVASGVSQQAALKDPHLSEMAQIVHETVFSRHAIEPNILIREYAQEICEQALEKGALPPQIAATSFRPPFRSKWPVIWSEAQMTAFREECHKKYKETRNYGQLLHSSTPKESPGFYGDWGRYVMGGAVHHFQNRRLDETPNPRHGARFDASICQRYIVQRALEIGLNPSGDDQPIHTRAKGGWPDIERLGKKYQWIAFHEFLGYLADHYHFDDIGGRVQPFTTARQMTSLRDLLDSHIRGGTPPAEATDWNFAPRSPPCWMQSLHPLKRPFSFKNQKRWIITRETEDPARLLSVRDGKDEWLALSGFWQWKEPEPVQRAGCYESPRLELFWMARSFVVPESNKTLLLDVLSESAYDHGGTLQFTEPVFSSALAELRAFPIKPTALASWCEFENAPSSRAWFTTCHYESHEEAPDGISGSMPSPQLAQLGNLRWLGNDFDFAANDDDRPLFRFSRHGGSAASHIRKDDLVRWLAKKKSRLVWRFHGEKNRYSEPHGECHQRRYWASYELAANGSTKCYDGGTHLVANKTRKIETLPWRTERHVPR